MVNLSIVHYIESTIHERVTIAETITHDRQPIIGFASVEDPRFGSLIVDIDLPIREIEQKERCLYYVDGSCQECVQRCPVGALDPNDGLDKQLCWEKYRSTAEAFRDLGEATVCGKYAVGVCAMEASVGWG
jgi:ferredoxin